MASHCQATEEKLVCWRESQISFALQMLASSGKYPHLRILNFGRLNFCGGTAAAFFSHNPFFISCCYYILHFVTAVYFKFFQVSSITSKAFRTEIIPLDGNGDEAQQDQEDESKLSMLSHSLMFLDHDIQFCCIFQ
jgi:hypothetical protein